VIVYERAKLSALPRYVGRPLAVLLAVDVLITTAYVFAGWKWLALPSVPLSIFGGVIGLIAGFRNASAYARWWEARTIWGGIVNSSRSFARQVLAMVEPPDERAEVSSEILECQRKSIYLQIAYVHALRHHLRGTPPWKDLAGLIAEDEIENLRSLHNIPLAIQQKIAGVVARCHQLGWIDSMCRVSLDRTLSELMDYQGASERIKNTPMPRLYDSFIRLFITIYCLLLPFGIVASLRLFTPVGSTLVGFIFLALDRIGRDMETPFENRSNDVPLTAISRTVEINLRQMIGERQVPAASVPIDGVLW
jgi:putative membrane protein